MKKKEKKSPLVVMVMYSHYISQHWFVCFLQPLSAEWVLAKELDLIRVKAFPRKKSKIQVRGTRVDRISKEESLWFPWYLISKEQKSKGTISKRGLKVWEWKDCNFLTIQMWILFWTTNMKPKFIPRDLYCALWFFSIGLTRLI